MSTLGLIVVFGLLMAAIALTGSLTLLLSEKTLKRVLLPLVAFSAGSLLGGAVFHMLPAAIETMGNTLEPYLWLTLGFLLFMLLEQWLHWHHCHRTPCEHTHPMGQMIIVADGLHNFIGGLTVGAAFIIDWRLGITTWIVAAIHEVPQELGDFGILLHSGWSKPKALLFNVLSGLSFLVGGLVVYFAAPSFKVEWLLPFAAGNFLYIAAADLIPEIKTTQSKRNDMIHSLALFCGLGLLLLCKIAFDHH